MAERSQSGRCQDSVCIQMTRGTTGKGGRRRKDGAPGREAESFVNCGDMIGSGTSMSAAGRSSACCTQ